MKVWPTIVDTASNLKSLTSVIPDGLIIKEINSNRFKVGNGLQKWQQLLYANQTTSVIENFDVTNKEYVDKAAANSNPVGMIILFYGTIAPVGYFICNGDEFNINSNPKLHNILNSTALPNMTENITIENTIYCIKHD